MDGTFRKLQTPQEPRGMRGQLARGHNIYKGGLNNPTPVGTNSRTGLAAMKETTENKKPVKQGNDSKGELWTRLAQLRLKGLI